MARRDTVALITNRKESSQQISALLGTDYALNTYSLQNTFGMSATTGDIVVFDVDAQPVILDILRSRFARPKGFHSPVVFVGDGRASYANLARALGANRVIERPLTQANFGDLIADLMARLQRTRQFAQHAAALKAGETALQSLFDFARDGAALSAGEIEGHGDVIIGSLAEAGLDLWIDAVRSHHNPTYQHCLLVTGVAVAYGQHLGFCRRDLRRLAVGSLLHDIGKAKIPLKILEKPGDLTDEEMAVMRTHAKIGRELLKGEPGFPDEMLALVAHHHEFLDGSGYPEGLTADSLGDLVRVVTIADIFAAQIEERPYKRAKSNEEAFDGLLAMKGKLDLPLVRAFAPVAVKVKTAA